MSKIFRNKPLHKKEYVDAIREVDGKWLITDENGDQRSVNYEDLTSEYALEMEDCCALCGLALEPSDGFYIKGILVCRTCLHRKDFE